MRIAIALLVSLISLQAQIPQPTDFEGWKNRGMALLLHTGQNQEAADAFERASNLKPDDTDARLYLGLVHMLLSVGARSPEKDAHASRARTEFQRVLALDSENARALAALAAMSYYEARPFQGSESLSKLHEARDWSKRVIAADRMNKQAYFSLGVIAWTEFYPAWMEARAADGLKPSDAGPLRTAASRVKLLGQYGPLIEESIANLREAIKIDPQYDRALVYMSLLVRERADLSDTPDQYIRGLGEASQWVQRCLDARREKSQRPQQAAAGSSEEWFESLALFLPPPPVPPPPPPPPPPPGVRPNQFMPAPPARAVFPSGTEWDIFPDKDKARLFAIATVDIPRVGVYKLALQCAKGGVMATIEAFTNSGEPRPIAWQTTAERGVHIRRTDDDTVSNDDVLTPTGLSHVGQLTLRSLPQTRLTIANVFPNETVEFSFSIMSTPGALVPVEKTKREVFQEMCFSVPQSKAAPTSALSATPVRVTGDIKPPTKTKDVRPAYPRLARLARAKGVVVLDVTIDPSGKVHEPIVLQSIPMFDEAAIDAVAQWEYTPTLMNGVAVPVIMTVPVSFAP